MAKPARWLIVNADDLGLSAATNAGIFQAHTHGIVTSASLMVTQSAAVDALRASREFPRLSIGLHVDLADWSYRNEKWTYEIAPLDDLAAVEMETLRQIARFRELAGRDPTHLDSHQHVHRARMVRPIFEKIAAKLALPLRGCAERIAFYGAFYGRGKTEAYPQNITAEHLCRAIRELGPGVTELSCHPGYDRQLDSDYRDERIQEVETLCDARVRAEIEQQNVALISFADLSSVAS